MVPQKGPSAGPGEDNLISTKTDTSGTEYVPTYVWDSLSDHSVTLLPKINMRNYSGSMMTEPRTG